MNDVRVDVLIVGAGPTGMTLACALARAGVSFHLIDKAEGRSPLFAIAGPELQKKTVRSKLGYL